MAKKTLQGFENFVNKVENEKIKRFNLIEKWLDKNMSKDIELTKQKKNDKDFYEFIVYEIEKFYCEFHKTNQTVFAWLNENYKGKDFFERHEELASEYFFR